MYCDAPLIICALGIQYSIPRLLTVCQEAALGSWHYQKSFCYVSVHHAVYCIIALQYVFMFLDVALTLNRL